MHSRQDFSPRSHRDTEKTSRSGSSDRFERPRLPVVLRSQRLGRPQRNKTRDAPTARFFTTEPQRHGENLKKWLVGQVRAFSSPRSFEITEVGSHGETRLGMHSRQDFSPRSHRDTEKTSRSGSSDRFERSRLPVVLRSQRLGATEKQDSGCTHGKIFHHGATETRRKPQEVARRTGSSVLVSP